MIITPGCENIFSRYSSTFNPFDFAVVTKEYIMAEISAPSGVAENSQFFLPTTKGLIALSARLLESGMFPSSRNRLRYFFSFRAK